MANYQGVSELTECIYDYFKQERVRLPPFSYELIQIKKPEAFRNLNSKSLRFKSAQMMLYGRRSDFKGTEIFHVMYFINSYILERLLCNVGNNPHEDIVANVLLYSMFHFYYFVWK